MNQIRKYAMWMDVLRYVRIHRKQARLLMVCECGCRYGIFSARLRQHEAGSLGHGDVSHDHKTVMRRPFRMKI
ncbi:hypothetical protein DOTSEDRAFT_71619 [Dothistroma septosporum NZE10]|uniref:Uncharacterized protein n=1 Tax=Dothistroma septosporum (strain NZE10 / CBS 128990) TaxID=675120 RepID=N1PKJ3_DOTSN|nr:hypothetical protein DOTSEDRAFT_71619 [Dothistroma septosporum NZE10]